MKLHSQTILFPSYFWLKKDRVGLFILLMMIGWLKMKVFDEGWRSLIPHDNHTGYFCFYPLCVYITVKSWTENIEQDYMQTLRLSPRERERTYNTESYCRSYFT